MIKGIQKNIRMIHKTILLTTLLFSWGVISSQTVVSSLAQLRTAVQQSNQTIVMTPGSYNWEDLPSSSRVMTFSGSNNTITLTGVYIKVPVGCIRESYLDLSGNNNIIIDGEFEDTYRNGMTEVTDFSAYNQDKDNQAYGLRGDPVLRIGGTGNLVQGLKLTVRGSFPYGYGSIYGIGADNTFGLNKRCGILINGVSNTLDSVEVQQRAFGHGIFMQGDADKTVIKNTLVEGRVRETKEMYTETNTYDLPYLANYQMPHEDFRALPTNEFHSLCEDGFRMYNIPGSITIENCVAKKMRGGFRLYLGGKAKVSNSKAIDCGLTNYNTQTGGEIVNSSGNFTYTTLLNYRLNRKNTNVELTIIPSPDATGSHNIADIDGGNHNITFHRTPGPLDKTDRAIVVTGDGSTIVNETEYTIILESTANNNTITSCGPVIDKGSGNNVTLSDCTFAIFCANTPGNIEAECYDTMNGVETVSIDNNNSAITGIQSGDWICFNSMDLTDLNAVKAIVGSATDDAAIEIRTGSPTGDLLGTIPVPNTGDLSTYLESSLVPFNQNQVGAKDLYFVFTGSGETLLNLDGISFSYNQCFQGSFNPIYPIEAEAFCDSSGITVAEISTFNQSISSVSNGDYIVFKNVDFSGSRSYNSIQVNASSNSAGGTIELRSGAVDGTLLMTVEVDNTGSWDEYKPFVGNSALDLEGMHDLYFVFKGTEEQLMKVDNFYFTENHCARSSYEAYNKIEAEDYCDMNGVKIIDHYIGYIQEGDYIRFSNVDFTSTAPLSVKFSIASQSSGGYVNVMLDDPTEGTLIATVTAPATGGWTTWKEFMVRMSEEVTGVQDVYLYFGGGINLDWIQFTDDFIKGPTNPFERFEAEIYDGERGTFAATTTDVDGNKELGELKNGDYIMHNELNLEEADSIKVRVASAVDGAYIEVRVGNTYGKIISFIDIPNTGSSSYWQTVSAAVGDVEGENDIYFIFKGEGDDLLRLNWLQFTQYQNSHARLESEDKDSASVSFLTGTTTDVADHGVGSILRFATRGNWIKFEDVDLNSINSVDTRYSTTNSDAFIEVRLGAADGEMIATINLDNTDGWSNWKTASSNTSDASGIHDVYFVFQTESSTVACSSNWFQFSNLGVEETFDLSSRIEAEDYNRANGTVTIATTDVDGENELGSIQFGDWILFKDIDLSDLKNIDVRMASPNDGCRIELRYDSYTGPLLAFIYIPNTGSSSVWETVRTKMYSAEGKHDVYLIFKGGASDMVNINWLQFNSNATGIRNVDLHDISIYPNPVQNYFTITNSKNAQLRILSLEGRSVLECLIDSNEQTISMERLNAGIYIVQVGDSKRMKSFKVMKQ